MSLPGQQPRPGSALPPSERNYSPGHLPRLHHPGPFSEAARGRPRAAATCSRFHGCGSTHKLGFRFRSEDPIGVAGTLQGDLGLSYQRSVRSIPLPLTARVPAVDGASSGGLDQGNAPNRSPRSVGSSRAYSPSPRPPPIPRSPAAPANTRTSGTRLPGTGFRSITAHAPQSWQAEATILRCASPRGAVSRRKKDGASAAPSGPTGPTRRAVGVRGRAREVCCPFFFPLTRRRVCGRSQSILSGERLQAALSCSLRHPLVLGRTHPTPSLS
nr:uncharacterized protein LOC111749625 [Loxodonta africana]